MLNSVNEKDCNKISVGLFIWPAGGCRKCLLEYIVMSLLYLSEIAKDVLTIKFYELILNNKLGFLQI